MILGPRLSALMTAAVALVAGLSLAAAPASAATTPAATPTASTSGTVGPAAATTAATTAAQDTPAAGTTGAVSLCSSDPAPRHFSCLAQRRAGGPVPGSRFIPMVARGVQGYSPAELQSAYALSAAARAGGAGRRVFIVDAYDDPKAESDLAVYRAQFGLPACTTKNGCFRKINQRGASSPLPRANTGWAGETALDLAMVSAICPRCGITLVEANSDGDDLFTAVVEATSLGAKYVSMSWGGPEYGDEPYYDSSHFNVPGVVYAAASGDDGHAVSYPASSPDVVAVGGTTLTRSSDSRGWAETAWSKAGSGCSRSEAKPSWQASAVTASSCSGRGVADVAAVANPSTGVAVYQTYGSSGWGIYGGTSAATPIIAAVYALAGTPSTRISAPATLYTRAAGLNDVTSGSNGSCTTRVCRATTGWDGPTGLGTPNGTTAFTASGAVHSNVRVTNPGSRHTLLDRATSLQLHASSSARTPLTYRASGLPHGLSLNPLTGRVSGTPRSASSATVTLTVTDRTGGSARIRFPWRVTGDCTTRAIYNAGFEHGRSRWTMTAKAMKAHSLAHSGRGYARLDGYGHTHTDRVSRRVAIPAGCHATLTYYVRVSSSDTSSRRHDTLTLTVNGHAVQRLSNRNRHAHYVRHTVNLSGYAGRTVRIVWTGHENSSRKTTFYLDDVGLRLS